VPRIPDDLVDRIKREIPIAVLVEKAGIELRRVGESLVGRCNRHDDSTPSLHVSPDKNLWHDLGACQKGGSTIDWVMFQNGIEFYAAARELAEEFFPEEAGKVFGARPSRRFRAEPLACPLDEKAEDAELDRQVVAYYHEAGKESPEFRTYLEKRGLLSPELVERFQLGLANRTLGMRLTPKLRRKLQARGWFRESGHEHLNGSLTIPILGREGEVLGCYGRKIRDDLRNGTPDHLYLPRPHEGVFNVEAFSESREIVLCEALLDAATYWRWGFRNVTSAYGSEGFTAELLRAFIEHGTEKCFIAFDRDEAGDRGAAKVAEKLESAGVACYRVLFPKGMDANEVALKMHPADKTLALFLRSAEWMGNGYRPHDRVALETSTHAPAPQQPVSPLELVGAGLSAADRVASPAEQAAVGPAEAAKEKSAEGAAEKGSSSSQGQTSSVALPASAAVIPGASAAAAPSSGHASVLPVPSSTSSAPSAPHVTVETPASPSAPIAGLVHTTDDEAFFAFEDRRYRVFGLSKCHSLSSLPITLKAQREGDYFAPPCPIAGWYLDKLDLVAARQRDLFEKRAAHELGLKEEVVRRDLGFLLGGLERLQEERIRKALAPKLTVAEMSPKERDEAIGFWKSPDLLSHILEHFTACGLVGEETNKLLCYVAAVSRLLDRPLAIVIQSSSAAGKTSLMEALLSLLPEETYEKYTAVSGKSLFYFDEETSLRHKVLAIVEEEGAEKATYPLKLLQSEGELRMASTGKDPQTGRLVTQVYKVEGPVMIILTTTAIELDPELENRCLRLTVDESREQTRLIHELQRKRQTREGLIAQKRKAQLRRLHQNAQRLLRPLKVLNPYEPYLTFVDDQTRTRRDHDKYLTIIEALALMHQHQRPVVVLDVDGERTECVEVTLSDIELANRLAGEVLGRTLDELPPQTRRFLEVLHARVTEICEKEGVGRSDLHLTRKQIRELTGWGDTQVKVHLGRLIDLEYLLPYRAARGNGTVFELLYGGEGRDGERFVLGLVDVETLRDLPTTANRSDFPADRSDISGERSGGGRAVVGAPSVGGRTPDIAPRPAPDAASRAPEATSVENSRLPANQKPRPSYAGPGRTPVNGNGRLHLLVNLLRHPPLTLRPARQSLRPISLTPAAQA